MIGWIKLHRCLIESFVFANPITLKIWIWLLIKATKKKRSVSLKIGIGYQDIEINPGELIFGRFRAEEELNIDGSTIYKHIKKLEDSGNISLISNNHYTIITICKWEQYQIDEINKEQPDNSQVTTEEQQSNNRVTTEEHKQESKECIESKEIIKQKSILFKNSEFSDITKFKEQFKNTEWEKADLKYYYDSVLDWSNSGGKRKNDWIATARNWMRKDKNEGKLIIAKGELIGTQNSSIDYFAEFGGKKQ